MIRKISMGSDIRDAMIFSIGQKMFGDHEVSLINKLEDGSYDLYLKKDGASFKWKNFNKNLPITIEYNLDF